MWRFGGMDATNIGLNAVVGRPVEEYGIEPTSFAEIRRGCYDIHERVRDMDANGVIGSMCFPSFPNLCGQLFARATDDRDLGLAVLRAYNDWHVEDWCGTYPGRFIPLGLVPIWDPDAMAGEVRRLAQMGCHAVSFSENPAKLKLPSFHSDHWDPFWSACADEGTIVCLHIGSSSSLVVTAADAPIDVLLALQPVNIIQAAADLLWSPVLRKFPDPEGLVVRGRDRLDPLLLGADGLDLRAPARLDGPGLRRRGSRASSSASTSSPASSMTLQVSPSATRSGSRRSAGSPTTRTPTPPGRCPPERLWRSLDGVSDDDITAMTHENAMRHFRFDPFAVKAQGAVHRRRPSSRRARRGRGADDLRPARTVSTGRPACTSRRR